MKLKKTLKQFKVIKIELIKGNKILGRSFLYLIKNDLNKRPYGLMEDVFVDEKYRGRGLGAKLIKKIIQEAKKKGCYKLIATSRISRPKIHKFYKNFGFKKWGLEFRMDL